MSPALILVRTGWRLHIEKARRRADGGASRSTVLMRIRNSFLFCQSHAIENRREGLIVLFIVFLWRNTYEGQQSPRAHHRNQPIRLLTAQWGHIAQIGRKPGLAVQTQTPWSTRDLHVRIIFL